MAPYAPLPYKDPLGFGLLAQHPDSWLTMAILRSSVAHAARSGLPTCAPHLLRAWMPDMTDGCILNGGGRCQMGEAAFHCGLRGRGCPGRTFRFPRRSWQEAVLALSESGSTRGRRPGRSGPPRIDVSAFSITIFSTVLYKLQPQHLTQEADGTRSRTLTCAPSSRIPTQIFGRLWIC